MNNNSLDGLWAIARCYGRVSLHTTDNGKYQCVIKFNTIEHVELEAKHPGYCDTPKESLIESIKIAERIVETTSEFASKIMAKRNLING